METTIQERVPSDADMDDSVFEYAGKLIQQASKKVKKSNKMSKRPSQSDQSVKQDTQALTDLQPCSALFRDFQVELNDHREQYQDDFEDEKRPNSNRQWQIDQTHRVPKREKDRRMLENYIGSRIKSPAKRSEELLI